MKESIDDSQYFPLHTNLMAICLYSHFMDSMLIFFISMLELLLNFVAFIVHKCLSNKLLMTLDYSIAPNIYMSQNKSTFSAIHWYTCQLARRRQQRRKLAQRLNAFNQVNIANTPVSLCSYSLTLLTYPNHILSLRMWEKMKNNNNNINR